MKDPMGMTERYLYDSAGNMVTKYDRNGTELRYDYDAMNRITKEYAKVGNSEVLKSTYGYDGRNNLVELNDGKTAISYWYNGNNTLGNTYVYQNGKKYQIFTGYDNRGNLTTKWIYQFIKSETVGELKTGYEYTYDKNNNMTKVTYQKAATENNKDLVTYTYDNMDNVTKETRGSITTDYTYNMAGLVTGMTNKNGSSVISTYSNTYNYDGNVAKAVENGVTKNYTYDYMNRLVSENTRNNTYSYTYDSAGNRASVTATGDNYYTTSYSYDKNNRLINTVRNEEGNNYITDYSYDKNGNQLTKVKSESWPSTTKKQRLGIKTASELSGSQSSEYFTYNVFNQLKSYRNTEGKTASYEYLPNNYRYSKTVGSTTTRFLWDGDYVAGELDSTGNISKKYFYGMDMLSDDSGNNYIYDIHGSVTNVLNSSGTKTGTYEYNAFGRDEKSTINSISNPWQYCGEYKDNETGLIYLRNRYYDPEIGRFINEDPVRDGGNWYSYASQNPIMFIDPFGLAVLDVKSITQKNDNTCAVANIAMVIGYKTKTNDDWESKITEIMKNPNQRQHISRVNYYIGIDEINKIYDNEKLNLGQDGYIVSVYEKDMSIGSKFDSKVYSAIKNEIDNDNPVILLYQGGSFGHFITVIGYEEEDGEKYIYYNDTADGKTHKKTFEEMEKYTYGNNQYAPFDSIYKATEPNKNEEEDY